MCHDDPKSNMLCFPGNPARIGHRCLYRTLNDIPTDDKAALYTALEALSPFYQTIAKALSDEMLFELHVLLLEAGTPPMPC